MILLAGCHSPSTQVAKRLGDLRLSWQTNLAVHANLPGGRMTWPEALAKLETNNLKLRQARIDVINSRESVHQIFKDLIPTLNLRAGVNKKISDLANVTANDVTFSADSFFNVPGLISFAARLYTARLFQIRSETAYELTRREQTIALYKLFLVAQDNQAQQRHVESQKATAGAMEQIDPFQGKLMLTQLDLKSIELGKEDQTLQQQAGELLGDLSYRWVFSTNGLPEFHYDTHPLPLDDTNRVAQLQLKLGAIELEAERLELLGIKLRYWPELNIFVSGPPIYQRNLGRETVWDPSEVRASADLFWWVDTRGYVLRQIHQARRQHAIARERLFQQNLTLMDRLVFTQKLLESSTLKLRQVNAQLDLLRQVPPAQNYDALQKYAADYQFLADQQRDLRRQIAELNTLFWFVDDSAWPHDPSTSLAKNSISH